MPETCGQCGAAVDETFPFALAWPPESDEDPGRAALHLCGDCAEALATNVLVNRSVTRGLDDVYDGVEPGNSPDESGERVVNLADATDNAESQGDA